jgi:ribosomal protein L11 methylase PrmA
LEEVSLRKTRRTTLRMMSRSELAATGIAEKRAETLGASFRDPSGFMFRRDGRLLRQVNQSYAADYDLLMSSGLHAKLVKAGLMIPHSEVADPAAVPELCYKVIEPERLPFISYPYEWSFSQLKDAAMATLSIQKRAMKAGLSLKDASAYNIQRVGGKSALIDTLSFEQYEAGRPWVAYRQFCQHFLAPLALMSRTDIRLSQLLRVYIDGVPLDLASRLLPFSTRLNFGLLTHIHLHARAQRRYAGKEIDPSRTGARGMTQQQLLGLVESLERTVRGLTWKPEGTEWANYYAITNYTDEAFENKKRMVADWTSRVKPAQVWDLGANTGVFSRIASTGGLLTVAFDIDPAAVEFDYLQVKKEKDPRLLPLILDLTNPSPPLGWHNQERESLGERGPVDLIYALALIHHLAISNNVPLPQLADFFHDLGRWLIIEFVPKSDSQVQKLLASRVDIFDGYTQAGFEQAFSRRFAIRESVPVAGSERLLYLLERID